MRGGGWGQALVQLLTAGLRYNGGAPVQTLRPYIQRRIEKHTIPLGRSPAPDPPLWGLKMEHCPQCNELTRPTRYCTRCGKEI